eukprot:TRINITY_DN16764_c0_g1_i1.p1 TRINITY_DN16764_c0_g1~~TRINITY_DN16764_c0_g1_i1.p1  ORF type:complete len:187 (-),score=30.49 TRINITY_DN16764_c0_g1_i1:4-564(-)
MTSVNNIVNKRLDKKKNSLRNLADAAVTHLQGSGDIFENLKKAGHIECPTLIVHGMEDDFVSLKNSKKLSAKLHKLWKLVEIEEAGHHDLETTYSDDYLDACIEFLESLAPELKEERKTNARKSSIPQAYLSPEAIIGKWLEELGILKYRENFIQGGYFDLLSVRMLEDEDLKHLGMILLTHVTGV